MVTYTAKSIKYQVIENHHFDDRQEAQKIAQMQSFEVGVSFLEEDGNLIPRMVYIDGAAFYPEASSDAVSQASKLQADLEAAQERIATLERIVYECVGLADIMKAGLSEELYREIAARFEEKAEGE